MNSSTVRTLIFALAGAALVWFFFLKKEPHRPTSFNQQVEAPPGDTGRQTERVLTLRSPSGASDARLVLQVTTRSGAVRGARLTGAQYTYADPQTDGRTGRPDPDRRINLVSTWREEVLPLRMDLDLRRDGARVTPAYMDFDVRAADDQHAELTWSGNEVSVVRTYRVVRPFTVEVDTLVTNRGTPGTVEFHLPLYHWITRAEESGKFFQHPWQASEGLCHAGEKLQRESRDDLLKRSATSTLPGAASFVALNNLYFATAVVPQGNSETRCRLWAEDRAATAGGEAIGSVYAASLGWDRTRIDANEAVHYTATAYFGPKDTASLRQATRDGRLEETVNLGFFALIARQLMRYLRFLYSVVHNWGVAILVLTVTIRIALLPLLARSMKSMVAMQMLKPELEEINTRLKDNPEAKTLATMELYRKHGVNPLSGCLPQIAQLPIWWALYTTLQTSVELFHAPFFGWLRDLSAPDPYYVLPLILGAVMFFQQKIMPPQGMDPTQAKMMTYFFPVFMTGISLFLPAGLALYMLVNSFLGIAQQWWTKNQMDKMKNGNTGGPGSGIVVRAAGGTSV